jgi:hypothetical protein
VSARHLTLLFAATEDNDLVRLLAREIDDEMVTVELHDFADQIRPHVAPPAPTLIIGDHRHYHPDEQDSVTRQCQMLTE